MHALLRTSICTHTCPQWCTSGARAARPPGRASEQSAGLCERGGGAHSVFNFGHSTSAGSAASSELSAYLPAPLRPRGAAPALPRSRAGRPRAPAMRARGSADGRRPATPPPPHPTPRGPARRPARQRARGSANAHGGGAEAGRTGSPRACTGRATRGAPSPSWRRCTCRAPRARAARARCATNGRTWGRIGPKPWKVATHALNTHPHARDRHSDAFGAATVP
jgi:hypothetical protein